MVAACAFKRNSAQHFIRNKIKIIDRVIERRSSKLQHFAVLMLIRKMMLAVICADYIFRIMMVG